MELGRDVGGIHHDSIEAHNMEIGIDAIGIYGCACDTQGMEVGGHINDNQHILNNTKILTSQVARSINATHNQLASILVVLILITSLIMSESITITLCTNYLLLCSAFEILSFEIGRIELQ
jgi:hypothetical protein